MVQISMIEPSHDRLGDKLVQCLNISGTAGPWINRPFHRHHDNIVVSVTMRIVALPEDLPVLLIGEVLRVQAMGGRKPVAARHTGLIHKESWFWRSTSKKLAGITPRHRRTTPALFSKHMYVAAAEVGGLRAEGTAAPEIGRASCR